jgi:hypothetical protein
VSFEKRFVSSSASRLQNLTRQPETQPEYRIVNVPTPITIRLFPDPDEIRLIGAPPSARIVDKERRLQKIFDFTPSDYRRRQRPEEQQMVVLLEDIRQELRNVKTQLAEKEHPRGEEVYITMPLTLDNGLAHLDFTDPAGNMGIPPNSVTQIPSGKLFSITVYNDPASVSDIKVSTNIEDGDNRARLVLRPGEKHAVDWKTGLTFSLNVVAVTGNATVIITGMV